MSINTQNICFNVDANGLRSSLQYIFTDKTIFNELIQNAERAGATKVVFDLDGDSLSVKDDGHGICDYGQLLTFAKSGWNEETKRSQHAYGMGFASVLFACEEISVVSGGYEFTAKCRDIQAGKSISLQPSKNLIGTLIVLKGIDESIRTNLPELLKRAAFARNIHVIFKGEALPSPHSQNALDADTYIKCPFASGVIYVNPASSSMDVAAYLQGVRLEGFCDYGTFLHIVHFNDDVIGRVPDRTHLFEHDRVKAEMEKALHKFLVQLLMERREKMGDDALFVSIWGADLKRIDAKKLNDIGFLVKGTVEILSRMPMLNDTGSSRVFGSEKAISRKTLEDCVVVPNRLLSNKLNAGDSFLIQTYLAACGNIIVLGEPAKKLDAAHWIHSLPVLKESSLETVKALVHNPKRPVQLYLDSIDLDFSVVFCDSVTIYGPLGEHTLNEVAYFDGENLIVTDGYQYKGSVVGQIFDFRTDQFEVNSDLFSAAMNELGKLLTREREEDVAKRLSLLLEHLIGQEHTRQFAGKNFLLTIDDEGEFTVEEVDCDNTI